MRNDHLNKQVTMRRTLAATLILLTAFLLLLGCKSQPSLQTITVDGQVYHYRPIEQRPVTDLEKDVLNARIVETDHCYLRYATVFEDSLARLIAITEESYSRVGKDLNFDISSKRPYVHYLTPQQCRRMAPYRHDPAWADSDTLPYAVINAHAFPIEGNQPGAVIAHELTHLVCGFLQTDSNPAAPPVHVVHRRSSHDFYEAVCQTEEPRSKDTLRHLLTVNFPTGQFLALGDIDTTSSEHSYLGTQVLRVLIQVLTDRYGKDVIPRIVKSMADKSVSEAIESVTGTPIDSVQTMWFDAMRQMTAPPN